MFEDCVLLLHVEDRLLDLVVFTHQADPPAMQGSSNKRSEDLKSFADISSNDSRSLKNHPFFKRGGGDPGAQNRDPHQNFSTDISPGPQHLCITKF